jgi:2-polyprenyl-3-methyl-5-hydroxy-6-metoxy-1,4-benzoquinol methylase
MSFFVHPLPSDSEITDFYNNYYKTAQYTSKLEKKIRRSRRRIRSLGDPTGKSFLDVGCNVGFAVEAARALGYKAHGIELDGTAVETARKLFPHCTFSQQDLAHLAKSSTKYDVVYCSEVIEHLTHPDSFVRALSEVMAPRGSLYLTTPDAGHFSLPRRLDELKKWSNFRPPEHLLYFTKKGLDQLLKRCGFTSVRFLFGLKPTIRLIGKRD